MSRVEERNEVESGGYDEHSGASRSDFTHINNNESSSDRREPERMNVSGRVNTTKKRFVFEESDSESDEESHEKNNNVVLKDKSATSGKEAEACSGSALQINNLPKMSDAPVDDSQDFPADVEGAMATDNVTPNRDSQNPDDLVEAQKLIEAQLRQTLEQEEEDRKMALKLQRMFQREQKEALTKRTDGYGTRASRSASSMSPIPRCETGQQSRDVKAGSKSLSPSSSPSPRVAGCGSPKPSEVASKSFSTAAASSSSRSRSLSVIDKNATPADGIKESSSTAPSAPCPHRASQGSENCSFCILTSPRRSVDAGAAAGSSQGSGGGKGGKGLKRKTSTGAATSKSKKRKDTV